VQAIAIKKMIERIKNILFNCKTEWLKIDKDNASNGKVFMSYVLPLALIPAVCIFIGYGVIGHSVFGYRVHSIEWGIRQAIVQFVTMAGGVYLTAWIINMLASSFSSVKDFNKAFALVAYSYTPALIGGILYIYPNISWLASICSIYSLVLLYKGMQPMMKTPAEKNAGYFVVSLLVMVAMFVILSLVLAAILIGGAYSVTRGLRY
jgi:hypothetical protein